ncbi:MAG: glycosyltransferase family 2 protein [Methanolobus sp.]|nr:glycosyltransferase family 2 protein [Methanolobus sp.]
MSIIIPTYNRRQDVLSCLSSLFELDYDNFEIIVVDTGSTDETSYYVKEDYPSVKLIEYEEVLGVVEARNIGIESSKGDFLLFVDSDNIVAPNLIRELLSLMEKDETIGFAGPKMYYHSDPGRIWYAGARINLLTSKTTYIGINEIDHGQYDEIKEVEHIPNVWMVRKKVIDKIGGLDTIYRMTYEESDWAMRAKKAGFKVVFCPTAKVWHKIPLLKDQKGLRAVIGFDTPYRIYQMSRNRTIFMKRFASKFNFIFYFMFFMHMLNIYYLCLFVQFRRFDLIRPLKNGIMDGVKISLRGSI